MRVRQGIADARLRREVHHHFKLFLPEKVRHALPVREVESRKPEVRMATKLGQSCLFQRHVVVGIQIVEAQNVGVPFSKAPGNVEANETRAPHNQYLCHSGPVLEIQPRRPMASISPSLPGLEAISLDAAKGLEEFVKSGIDVANPVRTFFFPGAPVSVNPDVGGTLPKRRYQPDRCRLRQGCYDKSRAYSPQSSSARPRWHLPF